jgi:hypothetical protein
VRVAHSRNIGRTCDHEGVNPICDGFRAVRSRLSDRKDRISPTEYEYYHSCHIFRWSTQKFTYKDASIHQSTMKPPHQSQWLIISSRSYPIPSYPASTQILLCAGSATTTSLPHRPLNTSLEFRFTILATWSTGESLAMLSTDLHNL